MRIVRFGDGREAEVPETYAEGLEMLAKTMNAYQDRRGGDRERDAVGVVDGGQREQERAHPHATVIPHRFLPFVGRCVEAERESGRSLQDIDRLSKISDRPAGLSSSGGAGFLEPVEGAVNLRVQRVKKTRVITRES